MSGILSKIFTIIKGKANDLGESVVNSNNIVLLEQQIREAEEAQIQAKSALSDVIAAQKEVADKVSELQKQVDYYKNAAREALTNNNEALARQIAERIAELQSEYNSNEEILNNYNTQVNQLKEQVLETQKVVNEMQRQKDIVRTTDQVQKAQKVVQESFNAGTSKVSSAKETLEKIKQRQQRFNYKMSASKTLEEESTGKSLDAKIQNAGLGQPAGKLTNADAILAELSAKP